VTNTLAYKATLLISDVSFMKKPVCVTFREKGVLAVSRDTHCLLAFILHELLLRRKDGKNLIEKKGIYCSKKLCGQIAEKNKEKLHNTLFSL
jgi:hypothetical protein